MGRARLHAHLANEMRKKVAARLTALAGSAERCRPAGVSSSGDFNGEGAGRGLNLAHSAHGVGIANVGQDRQTAETPENLASR